MNEGYTFMKGTIVYIYEGYTCVLIKCTVPFCTCTSRGCTCIFCQCMGLYMYLYIYEMYEWHLFTSVGLFEGHL